MNPGSSDFGFQDFEQSHLLNHLLFHSEGITYEPEFNELFDQFYSSNDDFTITPDIDEQANGNFSKSKNTTEYQPEKLFLHESKNTIQPNKTFNFRSSVRDDGIPPESSFYQQNRQEQANFSSMPDKYWKIKDESLPQKLFSGPNLMYPKYEQGFPNIQDNLPYINPQMMNPLNSAKDATYFSKKKTPDESKQQFEEQVTHNMNLIRQTKNLKRQRSSPEIAIDDDSSQNSLQQSKNASNPVESGMKRSRVSKMPKKEDLEERIQKLRQENDQLKVFVQATKQMVTDLELKRLEMEKKLQEALDKNLKESEIAPMIQTYKHLFSDFGEQRRKEVEFHLNRLEKLSSPAVTTKMTLYTLQQNFGASSQSPEPSLVNIMCEELDIDSQQKAKIAAQREHAKQLTEDMKRTKYLIDQLKFTAKQRLFNFEKKIELLQSILYPTQCAKLILWVSAHNHLLDSSLPPTPFHMEKNKSYNPYTNSSIFEEKK